MRIPFRSVAFAFLSLPIAAQQGTPAPARPAVPLAPVATQPAAQAPAAQAKEKPVYDEAADAKKDVAAAVARAKKENRRVLIQWGANWCGWCKWLAGTMAKDAGVHRELLYEYDVVHVDVGKFDKNKDLAKQLGAEFQAIPFLTILDGDGKALVQQNTEPFEAKIDGKDGHDPKKLLEFLKAHEAKPVAAADLRQHALADAKTGGKMVFLHFGAPWCGWCHKLEDWMAQPEVAAILGKEFVDCKVDVDRATGGKEMHEAECQRAGVKPGGIPWFVFLGADDALLAHSNDAKGNIGFPSEPNEIAHFVGMLQKVKHNLTDADIKTLEASLQAVKAASQRPAAGH